MAARPRETAAISSLIETADESATRTYNLLVLAMANDGRICEMEYAEILASAGETLEHTAPAAERIAAYDVVIERVGSLIHNGDSPRSRRLEARSAMVSAGLCRSDAA